MVAAAGLYIKANRLHRSPHKLAPPGKQSLPTVVVM